MTNTLAYYTKTKFTTLKSLHFTWKKKGLPTIVKTIDINRPSIIPKNSPFWNLCMSLAGKFKAWREWATTGFFDSNVQSYITCLTLTFFDTSKVTEASLLNKSSCSAPPVSVTKFTNVRDKILVTLCCADQVRLECLTNPPLFCLVQFLACVWSQGK